ncbi:MAG: DNA mismatch repair endonuclease MutL [Armatimonadetes bacterium]|nr:DNA mismatch repair endonuclease MutL [Armatimonadota bacterium]
METRAQRSIINILDDNTANKIAAGEVIERPASVVKELIENSLDAGATEIRIDLIDGGKRLIRVTDNGIGMSREDSVLSLKRHATSKIKSADDLFSIRTLGFRGEALPSIASVSHTEIVTRKSEEDLGTKITCVAGKIEEVTDIGAPPGTSVLVKDLFFNLPARQKFLKTAQTELGHITELVNRFAISHGEVDITLSHNDRVIFRSPSSNLLTDAVLTVFGRDAAEAVVEINSQAGPYKIYGVISKPSYSKANRSGQLFFVNRRFVRNRNLIHALDEAYRGILPQGRFPLLICFIDVPPEFVDVNVHPTKIEVKFAREWEVHNIVISCIRDALSSSNIIPNAEDLLPSALNIRRPTFTPTYQKKLSRSTTDELEEFRMSLASKLEQQKKELFVPQITQEGFTEEKETAAKIDPLESAEVLAQARNLYIIAQSPAGILLIDQHVAHERILYDQLSNMYSKVHAQRLIVPLTLNLGHREALVIEHKLDDFRALGFEIESFGKDSFIVRSIPVIIVDKNYERVLKDMIEELTELTITRRLLVRREALITTSACKMAIKAGDKLSHEEMARLISDLKHTSNPYLCPHGRPIVVCLSNHDLDKMFGR